MNRITSVSFENFKGQSKTVELTGRDIFTGPTGYGKSTILDALQIAILGHHPRQDKKPMAIMQAFASASPMSVSIITESGLKVTRTFAQKGDKFSQDIDVFPSYQERTLAEKNVRIAAEFGSFPVMFDINEFLSLSNDKQRDFIFGFLAIDASWDRERVMAEVRKEYDSGITPKAFECWGPNHDTQAGLANVIAYVKERVSYLKQKLTEAEAAAKQIATIKAGKVAMSLSLIEQTAADIAALREKLSEAEKELATVTERNRAISLRDKPSKTLRMGDLLTEISGKDLQREPLLAAIKEAQAEYDASASTVAPAMDDTAGETIKTLREQITKLHTEKTTMESEQKSLKREILGIEDTIKAIKKKMCPLVKDTCSMDFTDFLAKQQVQIDTKHQEIKNKEGIAAKAALDMGTRQAEISKLEEAAAAVVAAGKDALDACTAQADWIRTLEAAIKTLDDAGALRAEIASIGEIEDAGTAQTTVSGLKADITSKETTLKEAEKQKNTLSDLEFTLSGRKETKMELDLHKALLAILGPKGIQGRIVTESLTPFLDDINSLMSQIDRAKTFSVELTDEKDNQVFNLMCLKEGQKVPVTSLSSGESIIGYTSLIASFIKLGSPKGKYLFVDNVEHISNRGARYRDNFLDGLDRIAEGFDNLIVCGTAEIETAPAGWSLTDYYLVGQEVGV